MAQSSTYVLPTAEEWWQQLIEDIELRAIDSGVDVPPTAKGSDIDLKATALANALAVVTTNQVVQDNDGNPLTAEGAQLEEMRISDGLEEAAASASTGSVLVSVTALAGIPVASGIKIQAPGSQFATVVGSHSGVVTGSELPIVMSKVGSAGNLKAGTKVRFIAAPSGLATEATIVADMTDGSDAETDAKKRRRILNRRQNPPRSGNWSHIREIALGSTNAIDNAFVYPALGLPSSCGITLTAPWHNGGAGQSRAVSAGTIATVVAALDAKLPTKNQLYAVSSSSDEYVDLRLLLDVRSGNSAWTDVAPWPSVAASIYSVTSNLEFVVELSTASTAPTAGKTIALWSVADLGFRTATIQSVTSLGSNRYTLTVNAWQGGSVTVVSGLQVSPAAGNMAAWGDKLLGVFGGQTPGERCEAWQEPRSLRHPAESNAEPSGFGSREIGDFLDEFDELDDAAIASINVSEPTRVTPGAAANVLCLRSLSLGVL